MKHVNRIWNEELFPLLALFAIVISSPALWLVERLNKRLAMRRSTLLTLSGPVLLAMMVVSVIIWHYNNAHRVPTDAPFTATGVVCTEVSSQYPGWRSFRLTKKMFATAMIEPKKGYIVRSYGSGIITNGKTRISPMCQYYIGPDPALPEAARRSRVVADIEVGN